MTIAERIFRNEADSAFVDWLVLLTGGALLALSLVLSIAINIEGMTGTTNAKVETVEDWQPS